MFGSDIKGILQEIGEGFTIYGTSTYEYGKISINAQVTKPFIRNTFLEMTASYDSAVNSGDILALDDGRHALVTAKSFKTLTNSIMSTEFVLYLCNSFGKLQRNIGVGWNAQTYEHTVTWSDILDPAIALLSEVQFGNLSELHDEDIGQILEQQLKLYVPSSYGAKTLDRYVDGDGTNWKLGRIETHKFTNVDVVSIEVDTRE